MCKKILAALFAVAMAFCTTTCFAASKLEYFKTVTVMQPEVFKKAYTIVSQSEVKDEIRTASEVQTVTEEMTVSDKKLTLVELMKLKGITK